MMRRKWESLPCISTRKGFQETSCSAMTPGHPLVMEHEISKKKGQRLGNALLRPTCVRIADKKQWSRSYGCSCRYPGGRVDAGRSCMHNDCHVQSPVCKPLAYTHRCVVCILAQCRVSLSCLQHLYDCLLCCMMPLRMLRGWTSVPVVRIASICRRDMRSCAATRGTLGRRVGGGMAQLP